MHMFTRAIVKTANHCWTKNDNYEMSDVDYLVNLKLRQNTKTIIIDTFHNKFLKWYSLHFRHEFVSRLCWMTT